MSSPVAQAADHLGERVGVERGVIAGVGSDVHEDDLAGPGRGQHPGGHDRSADVPGGSFPAERVDGPLDWHVSGPVGDGDGAGVGVGDWRSLKDYMHFSANGL